MKTPIPFGKYYLLDRINVGGMAEVFLAKAFGLEGFERIVAVKRILPSIAEDKEFISMFIDEAKIAVQLNHANICQVYDLGKVEDSYFIALEYVSGRDLRAIFDRCKGRLVDGSATMPIAQACFVVMKVCEGLDYAHNKKDSLGHELHLVHRDVSPQNIIISYEGEVKLIDFGIAKAAGKATQTQAGILKGKFGYMSPEQVRGIELDRRSDVFSVGIVLYEILTGERLFVGESDFSTLEKVRNVEILPPTMYNRKIPEDLERIVLRALAREVEERYQSTAELHEDLQAFMYSFGEFYSRKDLSGWMKRVFREEVDQDRAMLEAFRAMRPEAAQGDRDRLAPRGTMTGLRPVGKDSAASSWTPERPVGEGKAESTRGPRPAAPTPAPLPPPPPRTGAGVDLSLDKDEREGPPPSSVSIKPARAAQPAPAAVAAPPAAAPGAPVIDDEDEYEDDEEDLDDDGVGGGEGEGMTMVDGQKGRVADFHFGEDELETQLYGSPPTGAAAQDAGGVAAQAARLAAAQAAQAAAVQTAHAAAQQQEAAQRARSEAARGVPSEIPAGATIPNSMMPVPAAVTAALSSQSPSSRSPSSRSPVPVPAAVTSTSLVPPTQLAMRQAAPVEPRADRDGGAIRTGAQPRTAPASTVLLAVVLGAVVIVGCTLAYFFLSARPGELVLYAEPESGLSVTVDGQAMTVNQVPFQLSLKPGSHQVRVEHAGYQGWSGVVQIQAGKAQPEKVKLQPLVVRTGGFIIKSEPSGAQALLDGQSLGQNTPMRVASVMPGTHRLELRLGRRVWQQQVTLAEGQTMDILATLPPEVAPPDLAQPAVAPPVTPPPVAPPPVTPPPVAPPPVAPPPATPPATPPTVAQQTPDKGGGDKGGGDKGDKRRHRPETDTTEPRAVRPREGEGFLRINSKPWTKILVDGADIGKNTPQTSLKLPAGNHQITLQNPQFNIRESFSVTIRSGETSTVVKNFLNND